MYAKGGSSIEIVVFWNVLSFNCHLCLLSLVFCYCSCNWLCILYVSICVCECVNVWNASDTQQCCIHQRNQLFITFITAPVWLTNWLLLILHFLQEQKNLPLNKHPDTQTHTHTHLIMAWRNLMVKSTESLLWKYANFSESLRVNYLLIIQKFTVSISFKCHCGVLRIEIFSAPLLFPEVKN